MDVEELMKVYALRQGPLEKGKGAPKNPNLPEYTSIFERSLKNFEGI